VYLLLKTGKYQRRDYLGKSFGYKRYTGDPECPVPLLQLRSSESLKHSLSVFV